MKQFFLFFFFAMLFNLSFGQIETTVIHGDATICNWSNTPIEILTDADEILWSPSDSLSCDDCFSLIANPSTTSTYTATLKKQNEADVVIPITITVLPNDVHFPQGDTVYYCRGEIKFVEMEIEVTAGDVHWTSTKLLDSILMNETQVDTFLKPLDNMIFYATAANTSSCTDSIVIQVDSLPGDMSISVIDPEMMPYCVGQKITMLSPVYEPSHFPNIEFLWTPFVEPNDGTPDSLYNLVWTAHDAKVYTYTRVTTNGVCSQTDKIDVPILKVMTVEIDPDVAAGCVGEEIDILVTAKDDDDDNMVIEDAMYEWKPMGTELSCTDCKDPVATLIANGSNTVKVTKTGYCPGEGAFISEVDLVPVPVVIHDVAPPCPGGTVSIGVTPMDGVTYTWSVTNGEIVGCNPCVETTIKTNKEGVATVNVIASSPDYCEDGGAVRNVVPTELPNLLPLVFTPNKDGKNDHFDFFEDLGINSENIVLFQVFNRWGTRIYNNDTPAQGWDGKVNGKDATQDVYLYRVELDDVFCNQKLEGDVTLLR